MMFTGLGIAVIIYMLVAISVVAVIPAGDIAAPKNPEAGILLDVVRVGAPDLNIDKIFPFLTVFAVANTALINMLMASRLIYGMANQNVLPPALGKVLPNRRSPWAAIAFTTVLALGLIVVVRTQSESTIVARPVRYDGPAAAGGVHDRQRLRADPAARPGQRALQGAHHRAGARCDLLRLPARARGPGWRPT